GKESYARLRCRIVGISDLGNLLIPIAVPSRERTNEVGGGGTQWVDAGFQKGATCEDTHKHDDRTHRIDAESVINRIQCFSPFWTHLGHLALPCLQNSQVIGDDVHTDFWTRIATQLRERTGRLADYPFWHLLVTLLNRLLKVRTA